MEGFKKFVPKSEIHAFPPPPIVSEGAVSSEPIPGGGVIEGEIIPPNNNTPEKVPEKESMVIDATLNEVAAPDEQEESNSQVINEIHQVFHVREQICGICGEYGHQSEDCTHRNIEETLTGRPDFSLDTNADSDSVNEDVETQPSLVPEIEMDVIESTKKELPQIEGPDSSVSGITEVTS